jgi:hypothetical protein
MNVRWFALVLVFCLDGLAALPLPDRLAEILTERERASTSLDRQEERCSERFAVTDCVNAVRKRRQAILLPLQQEENQLRLQERRNRESQRAQNKEKQQTSAGTVPPAADKVSTESHQSALRIADKTKNHHTQAQERASLRATVPPVVSAPESAAASNREAFAKKAAASLKRQQDRDQKLKTRSAPHAPLPLPP